MGGAVLSSGSVDTGQLTNTYGGGQSFTSFSGLGADVVIQSGPGRLDTIVPTNLINSGTAVVFYDSAVATSGGPFSTSGHKIVGFIPATQRVYSASGLGTQALPWGPIQNGAPFLSGLCAAPVGSGGPSFFVTFTPQTIVSGSAIETV